MKSWEQVLQAAMLGTEKKGIVKADLEPALGACFDEVAAVTNNREEIFLQLGSLVYNYRQSGFVPIQEDGLFIAAADTESKAYANDVAHQVLHEVIGSDSIALLRFWMEHCIAAGKIVQPEELPVLFNLSAKNENLRNLVFQCAGNRGLWLAKLNPDWHETVVMQEEDAWQTGTLEQRKAILADTRLTDPEKGRNILLSIWAQENAATRAELLHQLRVNISEQDLPWLEEICGDKSVKVKEKALELLKLIPSSPVMQKYEEVLRASVRLISTKGVLGIGAKNVFEINLTGTDEALFKSGIQQLSSNKEISDDCCILQQVISEVSPVFWEEHYHLSPGKVFEIFAKNKQQQLFIPALGIAAVKFQNADWALAFAHIEQATFLEELPDILPQKEAEKYLLKFLSKDESVMNLLTRSRAFQSEWSLDFARQVMRKAAGNVYQFNRAFYNAIIYQLPITIGNEFPGFAPSEDYYRSMWSKMSEHISMLIRLKQMTIKAFNQ